MSKSTVGIVGIGTYLPDTYMTAKEISDATNGMWSEDAVRNKLGIIYIPEYATISKRLALLSQRSSAVQFKSTQLTIQMRLTRCCFELIMNLGFVSI